MNFKEDSFMVAIALCVVFFVVAQALFFLVRAVKRAKELGIANQTIKNTIVSSYCACHRHCGNCAYFVGRAWLCIAVDKTDSNRQYFL